LADHPRSRIGARRVRCQNCNSSKVKGGSRLGALTTSFRQLPPEAGIQRANPEGAYGHPNATGVRYRFDIGGFVRPSSEAKSRTVILLAGSRTSLPASEAVLESSPVSLSSPRTLRSVGLTLCSKLLPSSR
jgi:hypothetical protein